MKKIFLSISIILMLTSCISTKSTIQNIDDSTPTPELNQSLGSFVISKIAKDKKYGYNQDYPVNVGFTSMDEGYNNQVRFLNALAGPHGEQIKFEKKDACCPFPTKKTDMGAGTIDIFEVSWNGLPKPIILYINRFEKGELMIPVGLSIRK